MLQGSLGEMALARADTTERQNKIDSGSAEENRQQIFINNDQPRLCLVVYPYILLFV
jgi:hypothetical protein